MLGNKRPAIVANASVFLEGFSPDPLLARESQAKQIMSCLEPAAKRDKPINVWLYGSPGTGKTATAKSILRRLWHELNVKGCYVNCWEHDSLYSVLDALVTELRMLGAERQATTFKLERLRRHLGDCPFVVVLDEIDRPAPTDRHAIIYCLSSLGKTGLICTSVSRDIYLAFDERIKSRLNPKSVEFKPYPEQELLRILVSRAEGGLEAGSWTLPALEKIARLAAGDARLAIQTLKCAAEAAEQESAVRITPGFVEKGWHSARDVKRAWLLKNLTEDHRLLYRLITRRGEILSGELWQFYCDHCAATGKQPIALRTFSDYVNDLGRANLIEVTRARVRGKVRLLRVVR